MRSATNAGSSDVFAGRNLADYIVPRQQIIAARRSAATGAIAGAARAADHAAFPERAQQRRAGRTSDGNVSYTARIAYAAARHVNVYGSYATGFKASSINLSRDSRPALSDSAAIVAGGLATANLRYGSRYALPETSASFELGMKANWGRLGQSRGVPQSINNFQTNQFNGVGFNLLNAGKESMWGVEFEGAVGRQGMTITAA
jgi:outer membrane receptor protein involved in Fe transport